MKVSVSIAFFVCARLVLLAQAPPEPPQVISVPESQVLQLRIAGDAPTYPAIAQAAKVEGVVRLEVRIAPSGTVESVQVLRGHPMLDQAALDAVRRWRFSPLSVGGRPVIVVTTVNVPFMLAGVRVADVLAAQDELLACQADAKAQRFADALVRCETARKAALQLPRVIGLEMRVDAEILLAAGLSATGRGADAVSVLESALKSYSGPAMGPSEKRVDVLRALTEAYASLGRATDAVKACDRAENELEDAVSRNKAFSGPQVPRLRAELRAVTLRCADLLDRDGKPGDAQKARQRAAKIK